MSIDTRSITSDIEKEQLLDANKLALQPRLDSGYSPLGVNIIEFVNVTTNIVTGTQTGT